MKRFRKILALVSAVFVIMPYTALASVKIDIHGDRRVYGADTPFDTYIDMTSTGYGLINNTATIKLTLKNGRFATDDDGNYLKLYVTDAKGEAERDTLRDKLAKGSLTGFGLDPDDDVSATITVPQEMIDSHVQIMFTATAENYGDVTLSLRDNRKIKYIIQKDEEEEVPEPITKVIIPIGSNEIYIGDEKMEIDVPAYVSNDVTKLPLRAVSEIFGADIYWNGAEKTILIEAGEDKIQMRTGDKKMFVNGFAVPLSAAPEISDGRAFVPLRDIAKIFGIDDIEWDYSSRAVTFEYAGYDGHAYLTYN